VVDVVRIAIEYHDVSNVLCCRISSAQSNILARGGGMDNEPFRPSPPMDEYTVEVINSLFHLCFVVFLFVLPGQCLSCMFVSLVLLVLCIRILVALIRRLAV
jgi:hypothetical protein